MLWIKGQPNPNELHDRLVNDPEFEKIVTAYLDQLIWTENRETEDRQSTWNPEDADFVPEQGSLDTTDFDLEQYREYFVFNYYLIIAGDQIDTWLAELEKLIPKSERTGPKQLEAITRYIQETGDFTLRRFSLESKTINNFNPWLMLIANSNTDIQPLLKARQSQAVIQYIAGYISKQCKIDNLLSIFHLAHKKKPTTQPSEGSPLFETTAEQTTNPIIPDLPDAVHSYTAGPAPLTTAQTSLKTFINRIYSLCQKSTQVRYFTHFCNVSNLH
jgi:hypothetical protein